MRDAKIRRPVNIHFVRGSKEIDAQLREISHQLKTTPSPEQMCKLTQILDDTASALKLMKKEASRACGTPPFHYFEPIENEIIHMYGRLQNAVIADQLLNIQQGMKTLREGGSALSNALALEKRVWQFLKDYRPSLEERRIVAEAQRLIASVKNPEAPLPSPPSTELAFEDYEVLFDIARSLYNHKIKQAKGEYYQLPESVREAVQTHLKHLMALLFEDVTETIQALIATAHQILGNGESYPTPSEIEELFLGLAQITACDTPRFLHDIKAPADREQLSG